MEGSFLNMRPPCPESPSPEPKLAIKRLPIMQEALSCPAIPTC